MSSPHLISYQLLVSIDNSEYPKATNAAKEYEVSSKNAALTVDEKSSLLPPEIKGLTYVSTDTNYYAECFKIHRYKDGYVVICVEDGRNYLLIPEAKESPAGLNSDIIPLSMPLDRLYLATSGAMCHFDILGAVDAISMSGIEEKDWYIESAKKAMESGTISYGGKYSAPDYEQIVLKDIDLAIENTMILHVPKVLEKLEKLGIPVFIDRSSYESVPLGRCEWIMVYGVLLGKEKEAKEAFVAQKRQVDELKTTSDNSKTVAFFSINSNHQIVTRSSDDYFARMISMGGGRYLAPPDDKNGNSSQMTISIEAFYDYARDADILLYNATIEEAPASIYELLQKEDTLTDYKAFNTGNVYVADKSIYQYANETGTIISNLNSIITGEKEETDFFHKIR